MKLRKVAMVLSVVVIAAVLGIWSAPDKELEARVIEAARDGNTDEVRRLLAMDRRLANASDKEGNAPLQYAVRLGNVNLAAVLLDNGADIEISGEGGERPLHLAAESCQPEMVKLLISRKAKVNSKDIISRRPLDAAVKAGNHEVIELLVFAGAWLDGHDSAGSTLIQNAAAGRPAHVAKMLLEKGMSAGSQHNSNGTPLQIVARSRDVGMARLLIEYGANVSEVDGGDEPLHRAAVRGRDRMIEFLLSQGAQEDIFLAAGSGNGNRLATLLRRDRSLTNARDEETWTPLHWAACSGQIKTAELLLNGGAKVNMRTLGEGDCPLHFAALQRHEQMVKMLISKGADVNAKGEDDQTPLYLAARDGNDRMVEYLLAAGAKVNSKAKYGGSILEVGAKSGNERMVKLLLAAGTQPKDASALCSAAELGSLGIVKLLLAAGAGINDTNWSGRTPLKAALQAGHIEVAKLLKDAGAEVDFCCACALSSSEEVQQFLDRDPALVRQRDHSDWTGLHYAASVGNARVAALLLSHGAEVDAEDRGDGWMQCGFTPLHLAAKYGNKTTIDILIAGRANVNARAGWHYSTPLLLALEKRHNSIARTLLENGANPNASESLPQGGAPLYNSVRRSAAFEKPRSYQPMYFSCLEYAVWHEDKEMIQLLARYGGDLNAEYFRPLLMPIRANNPEMTEFLIQNGADPLVAFSKLRRTFLHEACIAGNKEIVQLLLWHHADVRAKDRFSETPLDYALLRDYQEISALLREHNAIATR